MSLRTYSRRVSRQGPAGPLSLPPSTSQSLKRPKQVVEGLRCYTYRSSPMNVRSHLQVFSAQVTRRTVNRLVVRVFQAGYLLGFANGAGTIYGGTCDGTEESPSPVSLSSDVAQQTCAPGETCFRTMEKSENYRFLKAGCIRLYSCENRSGSCENGYCFTRACGNCNTVRYKKDYSLN